MNSASVKDLGCIGVMRLDPICRGAVYVIGDPYARSCERGYCEASSYPDYAVVTALPLTHG